MWLFSLCTLNTAWSGHTPESQELAEDIIGALSAIDMSQKEAALTMGLTEGNLSAGLSGVIQLSASRLAYLPPVFWLEFCKRRLARCGNAVIVDVPELAQLVSGVRALTAPKRMARMSVCKQREVA